MPRHVPDIEPVLLTYRDVARLLATTTAQVRNMRARGQLPAPVKIGGLGLRWPRAELLEWLREQRYTTDMRDYRFTIKFDGKVVGHCRRYNHNLPDDLSATLEDIDDDLRAFASTLEGKVFGGLEVIETFKCLAHQYDHFWLRDSDGAPVTRLTFDPEPVRAQVTRRRAS